MSSIVAGDRVALIAATSRPAAEAFAASTGIDVAVLLTKRDALSPRKLRRAVRQARAQAVVVHSSAWDRAANPQAIMFAAAVAPVQMRVLVDGTHERPLTRAAAITGAASGLVDAARVARLRASELRRLRNAAPSAGPAHAGGEDAVLIIWKGAAENRVGGSITHIAGIASGFQKCGMHVCLVTAFSPPEQLATHVDEIEIAEPAAAAYRLTRDAEGVVVNRALADTALRVACATRPRFLYQRHEAFLTAGADVADSLGVPLALEWNNSELWTRANWLHRPLRRWFDPIAVLAEARSVRRADIIAAVSSVAGQMAVEAGARAEQVVISPNAVAIEEIDAVIGALCPGAVAEATVGWIGTFGPWHGAETLVRAIAQLPPGVTALMIGDGPYRAACEELARSLGIARRVTFAGLVPHDEALRRLRACRILASPHAPLEGRAFFGSPTKLFEYMALERPIVASDLDQIGEVLTDRVTAFLVRPGDPASLARGIRLVLAEPQTAAEVARRARERACAAHTWEHRARALLAAVRGGAAPGRTEAAA